MREIPDVYFINAAHRSGQSTGEGLESSAAQKHGDGCFA